MNKSGKIVKMFKSELRKLGFVVWEFEQNRALYVSKQDHIECNSDRTLVHFGRRKQIKYVVGDHAEKIIGEAVRLNIVCRKKPGYFMANQKLKRTREQILEGKA